MVDMLDGGEPSTLRQEVRISRLSVEETLTAVDRLLIRDQRTT